MRKSPRNKLVVGVIVTALVFCLSARPTLNAADPEASSAHSPRSLAENLFQYATGLKKALHDRPLEERSESDYLRALDAYGQVIRLNTDSFFSAESLARRAELQREIADATGDSALYLEAIESFRRIVNERPQSTFVGDALINIAQIYEENLQDLDGAAAAYKEMIAHFPSSVLAREASAVLARFEAHLGDHPVDVLVSADQTQPNANRFGPERGAQLTNVRNFTGPDYARVVIDLSKGAEYAGGRAGNNHLSLRLSDARISPSLYGRRFIVSESSLLRRITVAEGANNPSTHALSEGVQIDLEVASLAEYSIFRLSNPERIVIDIHAEGAASEPLYVARGGAANRGVTRPAEDADEENSAPDASSGNVTARAGSSRAWRTQKPLFALPEITEPILPYDPSSSASGASGQLEAKIDADLSQTPIKCIVIDPGHGGHDTGTISSNGMCEKDLVLDVARRLKAYVKRKYPDVEVILTRDSDRFVALEQRTAIANSRRADLFISIHANASPSRVASGVETYFMSPDRAPDEDLETANRENTKMADEKTEKRDTSVKPIVASVSAGGRVAASRELARYIQAGLVRGIGAQSPRTAANRGVKHAPFVVLLGAVMPSVLAEISFLSNPRDEELLKTSAFRERIAASLFAGLNSYLKKNRPAESRNDAKNDAKSEAKKETKKPDPDTKKTGSEE